MRRMCPFCKKEFVSFLEHISLKHDILTLEGYKLEVKKQEEKNIKIQEYLKYIKELKEKFRKGEITTEQLRESRAKWEKDNNLIW